MDILFTFFPAAVRKVLGATGFEINYFLTKNKIILFLNNMTLCGRTLTHTHTHTFIYFIWGPYSI